MASADPDNVPTAEGSKPDLTLEKMKEQQSQFAAEGFMWVLRFAGVKHKFSRAMLPSEKFEFFTYEVCKVVVVITFAIQMAFRPIFPDIFQGIPRVNPAKIFETYVKTYVVKKNNYFYNFLNYVSFVMDLTMYCFSEGMDFIELGVECLSNYPDVSYFHSEGGWVELHKICAETVLFIGTFPPPVCLEIPPQKVVPILYTVQKSEEGNGYMENRWMLVTPEMRLMRRIRKKLLKLYGFPLDLNSSCFVGNLKTIVQKFEKNGSPKTSPQKPTSKRNDPNSPETASLDSLKSDRQHIEESSKQPLQSGKDPKAFEKSSVSHKFPIIFKLYLENVATDKMLDIDESRVVFIISKEFLENRKRVLKEHSISKYLDYIKICAHSKPRVLTTSNFDRIVDKNIEMGNYADMGNGAYCVCPPGCNTNDYLNSLIVLDASYEEKGRRRIGGNKTKFPLLDDVFQIIIEARIEQEKLAPEPKFRKPSNESENASGSTIEHKNVLSSDTGAIPKIKLDSDKNV